MNDEKRNDNAVSMKGILVIAGVGFLGFTIGKIVGDRSATKNFTKGLERLMLVEPEVEKAFQSAIVKMSSFTNTYK